MGNWNELDKMPAERFMETLEVNVDDPKLSDEMFRELVRRNLPIIDYPSLKEREDEV